MLEMICAGSIYHTATGACLMERKGLSEPRTVRHEVLAEGKDGEWLPVWEAKC